MTLFTISDLKKKYRNISKKEFSDFENSTLREKPLLKQEYDIFLAHSDFDIRDLFMLTREIQSMGFSYYLDTHNLAPGSKGDLNYGMFKGIINAMKRSNCFLFATYSEEDQSDLVAWQLGYFDCLKNRAAVLPVLKKDTNSVNFRAKGLLKLYPFVGYSKSFEEKEDTLWVIFGENKNMHLAYWYNQYKIYNIP